MFRSVTTVIPSPPRCCIRFCLFTNPCWAKATVQGRERKRFVFLLRVERSLEYINRNPLIAIVLNVIYVLKNTYRHNIEIHRYLILEARHINTNYQHHDEQYQQSVQKGKVDGITI
jgi:hypothetical protein